MKVKHVLASLALASVTAFALAVGVGVNKEAKVTKADEPDDKMISVVIDLGEAVGYEDFHYPEVHYYDASYSTIDKYEPLHQLTGTYYTANLTYRSSDQNIDCIQFLFKQYSNDKWSNSISLNSSESNVYHYSFLGTWTGDDWDVQKDSTWWGVPRVRGDGGFADTNFTADVSSKTYKVTVNLTAGNTYQVFYGKWNFGAFRQSSVDAYLSDYSLNSFGVKESGTYDIVICNSYEDGGIIQMYKHGTVSSYVYIINESTDCYLYTYGAGGQEQFGAFPGTQINDLISDDEAEDLGDTIDFQGKTTQVLRVNVEVGYPVADHLILAYKNEYGYVANQSANMLLVAGSAYWFSNDTDYHNDDAGAALDVLVELRDTIEDASGSSVCNISKGTATVLVNEYLELTDDQKETYFDCSFIETLKRDGSSGTEYVDCRTIIEQVAVIAEIALPGSSRYIDNNMFEVENTSVIAIIVIASTISMVALGTLLILKKKRK